MMMDWLQRQLARESSPQVEMGAGYYTVIIPPTSPEKSTKWHSMTDTLSRGVFPNQEAAHVWAKETLGGADYELRWVPGCGETTEETSERVEALTEYRENLLALDGLLKEVATLQKTIAKTLARNEKLQADWQFVSDEIGEEI